jgi:hypothetical protein
MSPVQHRMFLEILKLLIKRIRIREILSPKEAQYWSKLETG